MIEIFVISLMLDCSTQNYSVLHPHKKDNVSIFLASIFSNEILERRTMTMPRSFYYNLILLLALVTVAAASDLVLVYRSGSAEIKPTGNNNYEWTALGDSDNIFAIQYYKEETAQVLKYIEVGRLPFNKTVAENQYRYYITHLLNILKSFNSETEKISDETHLTGSLHSLPCLKKCKNLLFAIKKQSIIDQFSLCIRYQHGRDRA
jgi:hypothetical protein